MTEEERIIALEKKTKRLEIVSILHTLSLVLGTIGITTILVDELKKMIKK
jgi:hypothetical protein